MKRIIQFSLLLVGYTCLACLLQGCPTKKTLVYAIAGGTKGTWEWVKTTTPTRTITPQSAGYTKQVAVGNDNTGPYVAFYRNDTLQRRINETSRDTNHTFVNTDRKTVLIKYKGDGYINYLIDDTGQSKRLTMSEVLNPYTVGADTVRNLYERVTKPLYPY